MSFPILDLPTEVISLIFSFVSQKKDRRNLALISKRFHKIVRQQSKKHNCLNLLGGRHNFSASFVFEQSDEFPFEKLNLRSENIDQYRGLWLRHGAKITHVTIWYSKLVEFVAFGSNLKEVFPNLKALIKQNNEWVDDDDNDRLMTSVDAENFFSENIEDLILSCYNFDFKNLNSTLELFPGLKRLKITIIMSFNYEQNKEQKNTDVQVLKDLLDTWLPKLENIGISFKALFNYNLLLFGAFDGWINEKLSFEFITVNLSPKNIEILKSFFSVTRHIKSFEVSCADFDLDSNLCTLIGQNATIDYLTISSDGLSNLSVERLFNSRGVKKIHINTCIPQITEIRFTSEALLKVDEMMIRKKDVLSLPLFCNLRILRLYNDRRTLMNEDLELIVNNFPFLESLYILNLNTTSVRPLANLKHLRSLEINNSWSLFDVFFDFGVELPKLEKMRLHNVKLSLAGVKSIVTNCPQINELHFDGCTQITEECVDFIAQNLFYIERIELIESYFGTRSLGEKYPEIEF